MKPREIRSFGPLAPRAGHGAERISGAPTAAAQPVLRKVRRVNWVFMVTKLWFSTAHQGNYIFRRRIGPETSRPIPLGFERAEVDLKTRRPCPREIPTIAERTTPSCESIALPRRRDFSRDPKLNSNSHDGVVRSAVVVHPYG